MMQRLFIYGSLNMDYVFTLDRLPEQGETLAAQGFLKAPGGKGANQAVAAARIGADVSMLGHVGHDEDGTLLRTNLKQAGVQDNGVLSVADSTGLAIIHVSTLDNRIILHAGANGHTQCEEMVQILDKRAQEGDWLLVQFEKPLVAIKRMLQAAKQRGLRTVVNPAPMDVVGLKGLFGLIDVLILNETEYSQAFPRCSIAEPMAAFKQVGVRYGVLTLGRDGLIACDVSKDKTVSLPGHTVYVVDTTGAGDTFVGVLVAIMAEGEPFLSAVQWANLAAALSTMRLGAQSGMPNRHTLQEAWNDLNRT